MAKFSEIQFEALGEFIQRLLKDPDLRHTFKHGTQEEIKNLLRDFMTPRNKTWEEITIVAHFDEENVVNIAFPFPGDVEETVLEIAPETGPGSDYPFPDHYRYDPNVGATQEQKKGQSAAQLPQQTWRLCDVALQIARCYANAGGALYAFLKPFPVDLLADREDILEPVDDSPAARPLVVVPGV